MNTDRIPAEEPVAPTEGRVQLSGGARGGGLFAERPWL
jgi:hypothetical protein